MSTTVTLTGGRQLNARLNAMAHAPQTMLRTIALSGVREAKILVPRRTGNLGRTIRMGTVTATDAEIRAGGQLDVGDAAAVELGSIAHDIVPRTASVLAWGGPRTLGGRLRAGGRPTNFARRVRHPGTRPHPYLVPGLQKALNLLGLGPIIDAWNKAG
ncbi:MAG: hypothetical protein ABI678_05055 [Kofleriaceae bacterium]